MLVEKKDSKELDLSKTYALIEEVLATGNVANLTSEQRVMILKNLCESLGLNYRTRPFAFIPMNGRTVLYATKDCTDQLRNLHKVSIDISDRTTTNDVFMVTAKATFPDGRTDTSIGAVSIGGLRGDALANAYMKAETKSKRRVTLSICGLGLLDESEVSDIPEVKNRALDQIASTVNSNSSKHTPLYGKPTDKQLKRLFAITKAANWDPEAVTSLMSEKYDKLSSKDLNIDEYNELCKIIEENPIKPMDEAEPFPFETEGK